MDLISVIVPVYKVEKYLDRCVESIVNQTYKNLEIILVDDGSPDNCGAMCDKWAEKDSRIKVIHKENGGLSDARNAGMDIATGDLMGFVDSDDWIHENYICYMLQAIKICDAEIAACDISIVTDDDSVKSEKMNFDYVEYTNEEAMSYLTQGQKVRAVAWNKLYSKKLLKNERFPYGRFHEDEFFTYKIIGKTNKVLYVNCPLYYYYQRVGSIMNSISVKHLDALDAYLERIEYLKIKYPQLYRRDKIALCMTCVNMYNKIISVSKDTTDAYNKRIKNCRSSIKFTFKELSKCSLKELVYIIGSKYSIGLLSRILSLRKK